ncbi:glycerol phosphotransferase WchX [Streptococcus pneumoniae]|nr:glycerol phosphotransferase WchX [Streptococcus pneumoniae]
MKITADKEEEVAKKETTFVAAASGKGTTSLSSCQLQTQTEQFSKSFWLADNVEILEYGLPRNDDFFQKKKVDHINHTVRSKYNISLDELVILYMPTFRDDASTKAYNLDYDKVINSFQDFYITEKLKY